MTETDAAPVPPVPPVVIIAQGALARMRELAGHLAEAGIASELLRPGPRSLHA